VPWLLPASFRGESEAHRGLLFVLVEVSQVGGVGLLTRIIQVDIVLSLRVAGENDTGVRRHDEVLWLVQ
jgi:hypothetical protein